MRTHHPTDVRTTTRADDASSTLEVAGFFGPSGDRLFGTLTIPSSQPRAWVLISSSLFAEQARNYRREVIVSRELSLRGIASLRFHYRGTGHSEGDGADLTLETMCDDASLALGSLRERWPALPCAFSGTRLGAFVAASVARTLPSAPLLLWDPISTSSPFFDDAVRARRAGGMVADKEAGSGPVGASDDHDVWSEGSLDSVGYRFPPGLRDSFEGISLPDVVGEGDRPILIVTMVPRYEVTSLAETAADLLRDRTGSEVRLHRIDGRLTWWTSRDSWDPDEEHAPTMEVISRSVSWIEEQTVEVGAA